MGNSLNIHYLIVEKWSDQNQTSRTGSIAPEVGVGVFLKVVIFLSKYAHLTCS